MPYALSVFALLVALWCFRLQRRDTKREFRVLQLEAITRRHASDMRSMQEQLGWDDGKAYTIVLSGVYSPKQ